MGVHLKQQCSMLCNTKTHWLSQTCLASPSASNTLSRCHAPALAPTAHAPAVPCNCPNTQLPNRRQVYLDLDCTLLEMNPFTFDAQGAAFPLDMRCELDDTARFRNGAKWGEDLEFPLPFGRALTPAEEFVSGLDEVGAGSIQRLRLH